MTQTPPNDVAGLVARLSELLAKATPGPWFAIQCKGHTHSDIFAGEPKRAVMSEGQGDDADIELAVEAVNALPTLLATLSTPAPVAQEGELRAAVFERDDECNVEFGTVPDCDCPHEHWHVNGVCLDVHIEEDRTGHIILTLEDDPIELHLSGVAGIEEARAISFAWAAKRLNLAPLAALQQSQSAAGNLSDATKRMEKTLGAKFERREASPVPVDAGGAIARAHAWIEANRETFDYPGGEIGVRRDLRILLAALTAAPPARGEASDV